MTDKDSIQLEKYIRTAFSRRSWYLPSQSLERNRPFNPEELERLVLPEKLPWYDLSSSGGSDQREQRSHLLSFLDQISERETAKNSISPEQRRTYRDRALKLRKKIDNNEKGWGALAENAEGSISGKRRGGEGECWQKTLRSDLGSFSLDGRRSGWGGNI